MVLDLIFIAWSKLSLGIFFLEYKQEKQYMNSRCMSFKLFYIYNNNNIERKKIIFLYLQIILNIWIILDILL